MFGVTLFLYFVHRNISVYNSVYLYLLNLNKIVRTAIMLSQWLIFFAAAYKKASVCTCVL